MCVFTSTLNTSLFKGKALLLAVLAGSLIPVHSARSQLRGDPDVAVWFGKGPLPEAQYSGGMPRLIDVCKSEKYADKVRCSFGPGATDEVQVNGADIEETGARRIKIFVTVHTHDRYPIPYYFRLSDDAELQAKGSLFPHKHNNLAGYTYTFEDDIPEYIRVKVSSGELNSGGGNGNNDKSDYSGERIIIWRVGDKIEASYPGEDVIYTLATTSDQLDKIPSDGGLGVIEDRGYIFWSAEKSMYRGANIFRSRINNNNEVRIGSKSDLEIADAEGIAVDKDRKKVYWKVGKYILSTYINGKSTSVLLENESIGSNISILEDHLYYSEIRKDKRSDSYIGKINLTDGVITQNAIDIKEVSRNNSLYCLESDKQRNYLYWCRKKYIKRKNMNSGRVGKVYRGKSDVMDIAVSESKIFTIDRDPDNYSMFKIREIKLNEEGEKSLLGSVQGPDSPVMGSIEIMESNGREPAGTTRSWETSTNSPSIEIEVPGFGNISIKIPGIPIKVPEVDVNPVDTGVKPIVKNFLKQSMQGVAYSFSFSEEALRGLNLERAELDRSLRKETLRKEMRERGLSVEKVKKSIKSTEDTYQRKIDEMGKLEKRIFKTGEDWTKKLYKNLPKSQKSKLQGIEDFRAKRTEIMKNIDDWVGDLSKSQRYNLAAPYWGAARSPSGYSRYLSWGLRGAKTAARASAKAIGPGLGVFFTYDACSSEGKDCSRTATQELGIAVGAGAAVALVGSASAPILAAAAAGGAVIGGGAGLLAHWVAPEEVKNGVVEDGLEKAAEEIQTRWNALTPDVSF